MSLHAVTADPAQRYLVPVMPSLLSFASRRPTFAIDLGTAFVRVSTPGEPVAVERATRTDPQRPPAMVGGVVYDIDTAADVLVAAMQDAALHRVRRAHLLVSVPATATSVERAGVRWALHAAGVRGEVVLIEEPLAAAVGLGLDIADERPHFVVDVGHGITEAAVIAAGCIRAIGAARLGAAQLADPLRADRALGRIGRVVAQAIADLPADELAAIDRLHLVGGGSYRPEVTACLAAVTGLPVVMSDDRHHAVVRGDAACAAETFRSRPGSARRR